VFALGDAYTYVQLFAQVMYLPVVSNGRHTLRDLKESVRF